MEEFLLENYNQITSGVYKVLCTGNNEFYIGSSNDVKQRTDKHFSNLDKQLYSKESKSLDHKPYMQNSYNKYGKNSFKCFIIEQCNIEILLEREQYYINTLKPKFNTCLQVSRPPSHSELTLEQQKQKRTRLIETKTKNNTLKPSQETIQKWLHTRKMNNKLRLPETARKMIATKIKNNTLNASCLKSRGVKRPKHSEFMRKRQNEYFAQFTLEQRKQLFGRPGVTARNLKPKIKLLNKSTGIIKELHAFEWVTNYSIKAPQLSRLRTGKQDHIFDKDKIEWVIIRD